MGHRELGESSTAGVPGRVAVTALSSPQPLLSWLSGLRVRLLRSLPTGGAALSTEWTPEVVAGTACIAASSLGYSLLGVLYEVRRSSPAPWRQLPERSALITPFAAHI